MVAISSPGRLVVLGFVEALLWTVPSLAIRKKATVARTITDRMGSQIMTAMNSSDLADVKAAEDMVRDALEGVEKLSAWDCESLTAGLRGQLVTLREMVGGVDVLPDRFSEILQEAATQTATAVMAIDEKKCLQESMTDETVRLLVDGLHALENRHFHLDTTPAPWEGRAKLAFDRLKAWQEALVSLGANMVDRDTLYPRDVTSVYECPQPCSSCSVDHNSLFKGEESNKFKCILAGRHKNMLPSRDNPKFECETATRRSWAFWEYKTWCTVPGWLLDSYQNARIAAMVTCGTHSLLGTLRSNAVMSQDVLRTCMLVEQRMVVDVPTLSAFKDFMALEDDGVVPLHVQSAFSAYVTIATAEGLVGLRDTSTISAPDDGNWEELLRGNGFTLLPPQLVNSVPCKPPDTDGKTFLGALAAVAAVGSATMLAALASIPMILLTGFFFVLAGLAFVATPLLQHLQVCGTGSSSDSNEELKCSEKFDVVFATMGMANLQNIPRIFVSVFTRVSSAIYNALVPSQTLKPCPGGVLFLLGSAPLCVADMEKLEVVRYTCPLNPDRTVVVSCEAQFQGVMAIRGEPCSDDGFAAQAHNNLGA